MGLRVRNVLKVFVLSIRFYSLRRHFSALYTREINPLFSEVYQFLPEDQRKRLIYRVKNYTTTLAPFFGSLLYRLHDLSPNAKQRRLLALAGAATAFFDMIYDENWKGESLLVFPPRQADDPVGRLVYGLYQTIMREAPMPEGLLYWINRISRIEQESCAQKGELTQEEIERITFNKGGAGLMVFRQLVPVELNQEEENALMIAGGAIQLMDDMADVWQDIQEKITTPAVFHTTPAALARYIEGQFYDIYQSLRRTGFSRHRAGGFCFTLYAAFLVGKIHAFRLTVYLQKTGKPLASLSKPEVVLKPDMAFWLKYLGQISKFNCPRETKVK